MIAHTSQGFSSNFHDDEFLASLKNEFICRYNVESELACEMALDIFDVLTLSDANLETIKSIFYM